MSEYEARRLLAWLRKGNHALVLVEDHAYALHGLAGSKARANNERWIPAGGDDGWEWEMAFAHARKPSTARPSAPSFLSAAAPTLRVRSSKRFLDDILPEEIASRVGGAVPLYRDTRGVVVAYSAIGNGGIVWCCSPWSFSNEGLAAGHNLDFLLALANLTPGAPVIFDEYHHGFGAEMSVWTLAPPVTKLGIAQCLLAFLVLLAMLSWRFGPPRLPAEERYTRSRAEYLTAMTSLLERARATHVVRDRLSVFLYREVGKRLGLPARADQEKILASNARHPVVEQAALEHVSRQLDAMRTHRRPAPEAVFRVACEIHRLLRRGE